MRPPTSPSPARRVWRRIGTAALLLVTLLAGAAVTLDLSPRPAAAAPAGVNQPIARSEVLARAESWTNKGIQYDQASNYPDPDGKQYRTDCSGYVSMAWHLSGSRVVSTNPRNALVDPNLSHQIGKDDLKAGDALVKWDTHVRLFERWTNAEHTRYIAYDFGATPVKHQEYEWNGAGDYQDYAAYRYNNIVEDDGSAPPAPPSQPQPAKYFVDTFEAGPGRSEPSQTSSRIGTLNSGTNYVWCKKTGATVTDGSGAHNRFWLWTDLDTGAAQGWVSAYYLSRWGNDEARDNSGAEIPDCI